MTTQTIPARIVFRRDTAAAWTTANPVLLNGELGLETDTRKLKIGDGASPWGSLAYYSTSGGGGGGNTILSGSGAPSSGLGVNGDVYLDSTASRLYGPKAAGSWGSGVSLIGSAGSTGAAGAQGPAGTAGTAGSAATVAVGTVTTGAAGSSASVSNAGTSSAAVLNFTIPRGDAGAAGTAGASGSQGPAGAAGAAATISVGSVTTGAAGSSASVTNTGTSGAAVFAFTIPRGDTGATGSAGAAGAAGSAATVSVGTVTTGAAGSSASVTNTGTSGAAVFAFTIPRGDTGATGSTGPAGPVAGTTGQIIFNNAGSAGGLTPLGLAISGTNLATLADLVIPLSDETTALTASSSVAKVTIPYWPRATVLTDLPIWAVATAPTGAALQFDIQVGGTSIYLPASGGTYPTIAAGSANSTASTGPGAFTTAFAAAPTIAVGSSVAFFVRQIGSTVAGAGLKVALLTRRAG